jgi:hypothetical protein
MTPPALSRNGVLLRGSLGKAESLCQHRAASVRAVLPLRLARVNENQPDVRILRRRGLVNVASAS